MGKKKNKNSEWQSKECSVATERQCVVESCVGADRHATRGRLRARCLGLPCAFPATAAHVVSASSAEEEEIFFCYYCDRVFDNEANLIIHQVRWAAPSSPRISTPGAAAA